VKRPEVAGDVGVECVAGTGDDLGGYAFACFDVAYGESHLGAGRGQHSGGLSADPGRAARDHSTLPVRSTPWRTSCAVVSRPNGVVIRVVTVMIVLFWSAGDGRRANLKWRRLRSST
jgi:hypothetical protein